MFNFGFLFTSKWLGSKIAIVFSKKPCFKRRIFQQSAFLYTNPPLFLRWWSEIPCCFCLKTVFSIVANVTFILYSSFKLWRMLWHFLLTKPLQPFSPKTNWERTELIGFYAQIYWKVFMGSHWWEFWHSVELVFKKHVCLVHALGFTLNL